MKPYLDIFLKLTLTTSLSRVREKFGNIVMEQMTSPLIQAPTRMGLFTVQLLGMVNCLQIYKDSPEGMIHPLSCNEIEIGCKCSVCLIDISNVFDSHHRHTILCVYGTNRMVASGYTQADYLGFLLNLKRFGCIGAKPTVFISPLDFLNIILIC